MKLAETRTKLLLPRYRFVTESQASAIPDTPVSIYTPRPLYAKRFAGFPKGPETSLVVGEGDGLPLGVPSASLTAATWLCLAMSIPIYFKAFPFSRLFDLRRKPSFGSPRHASSLDIRPLGPSSLIHVQSRVGGASLWYGAKPQDVESVPSAHSAPFITYLPT